jgi:hypothetical protein
MKTSLFIFKFGLVSWLILLFTGCSSGNNQQNSALFNSPPPVQAGESQAEKPDFPETSNSSASEPFALMNSEAFGDLKLGMNAEQVLSILGVPETKSEIQLWEADGLHHQDWRYLQQGMTLNMTSETPEGLKTVNSISMEAPGQLRTKGGIGLGDSWEAVERAYGNDRDPEFSEPGQTFVAGSIYGGLIFSFQNNRVTKIFLGAAAE